MLVQLDHVKKIYDDFALELNMQIPENCVTGLIGANGAGKSTAFKLMLGLIRPDYGTVNVLDRKASDLTVMEKEKIGTVFSDSGFSEYLTVQQVIHIMKNFYTDFNENLFQKQCEKLEIPLKKQIKEFSTGMKVKLKVLVAISHNAKLLLLDEPTAGLDVIARDELLEMLREFLEKDEERSILISSHISSDLQSLCDDLYMIHDGKIILHEDTDVLLSDYALLKVDAEQYSKLDKQFILRSKKETYGYSCLTNQKQYYMENYPKIAIEKGTIDEVITMMIRGTEQ